MVEQQRPTRYAESISIRQHGACLLITTVATLGLIIHMFWKCNGVFDDALGCDTPISRRLVALGCDTPISRRLVAIGTLLSVLVLVYLAYLLATSLLCRLEPRDWTISSLRQAYRIALEKEYHGASAAPEGFMSSLRSSLWSKIAGRGIASTGGPTTTEDPVEAQGIFSEFWSKITAGRGTVVEDPTATEDPVEAEGFMSKVLSKFSTLKETVVGTGVPAMPT